MVKSIQTSESRFWFYFNVLTYRLADCFVNVHQEDAETVRLHDQHKAQKLMGYQSHHAQENRGFSMGKSMKKSVLRLWFCFAVPTCFLARCFGTQSLRVSVSLPWLCKSLPSSLYRRYWLLVNQIPSLHPPNIHHQDQWALQDLTKKNNEGQRSFKNQPPHLARIAIIVRASSIMVRLYVNSFHFLPSTARFKRASAIFGFVETSRICITYGYVGI